MAHLPIIIQDKLEGLRFYTPYYQLQLLQVNFTENVVKPVGLGALQNLHRLRCLFLTLFMLIFYLFLLLNTITIILMML